MPRSTATCNRETAPRSRIVVIDTPQVYERAKQIREVFYGKQQRKAIETPFTWPERFIHMGRAVSELYFSNKMLNGGFWEIYKHVAEAGQDLYINPKITHLFTPQDQKARIRGERCCLQGPMPKFISDLAENKGVQAILHNGEYYEIRLPHTITAAAKKPDTDETFLLIYSREGVHFVITGEKLSIGKDGIEW